VPSTINGMLKSLKASLTLEKYLNNCPIHINKIDPLLSNRKKPYKWYLANKTINKKIIIISNEYILMKPSRTGNRLFQLRRSKVRITFI
jgi:hypothetical protein